MTSTYILQRARKTQHFETILAKVSKNVLYFHVLLLKTSLKIKAREIEFKIFGSISVRVFHLFRF